MAGVRRHEALSCNLKLSIDQRHQNRWAQKVFGGSLTVEHHREEYLYAIVNVNQLLLWIHKTQGLPHCPPVAVHSDCQLDRIYYHGLSGFSITMTKATCKENVYRGSWFHDLL